MLSLLIISCYVNVYIYIHFYIPKKVVPNVVHKFINVIKKLVDWI